jgi:hypothetical protein
VLNTGGTFHEIVNNDDAIRAHKETKKRKAVATPSGSAPLKYRTVYHHDSTNLPQQLHQYQHQHQCLQQQWDLAHLRASPSGLCLRLYLHLHL